MKPPDFCKYALIFSVVSVSLENWEYIIAEGFFLELQELTPKSNLQ